MRRSDNGRTFSKHPRGQRKLRYISLAQTHRDFSHGAGEEEETESGRPSVSISSDEKDQ